MGGCLSSRPLGAENDGASRDISDASRAGTAGRAAATAGPSTTSTAAAMTSGGAGGSGGSGGASVAEPYRGAPAPTCEIERLAHLNSLGVLDTVRFSRGPWT